MLMFKVATLLRQLDAVGFRRGCLTDRNGLLPLGYTGWVDEALCAASLVIAVAATRLLARHRGAIGLMS